MAQQSSTRSPSSRLPAEKTAPTPPIGQLKTPQDAAVAGVGARLGELGSKLSALSGFGREGAAAGEDAVEVKEEGAEGTEEKGEQDYDPFTGAPLRRLTSLPPFSSGQGQQEPSLSHQLWAHLATVRRLQAELAAQHVAMENVTGLSGGAGEGGRGGAGTGVHDLNAAEAARNLGEKEGELGEERGRERQEAVKGIMSKLDELSRAVTAYHGVVTPSLDLAPTPGRTRSTTLSHGTAAHDGAFSDSALSELSKRGEENVLGLGRGWDGLELAGRGRDREGRVLGEEVVESPVEGSHVRGFEV